MSCASFLVRNSQAWHPRLPCSLCVDQSTQRPDCRRSQPIVLGSPTSVTEFLDVDRVPHLWPLSGKACAFQYAIIGKGFRGRSSDSGQPVSNLSATCQRSARKEPSFLQLPTTRNARSVLPESHSVHRAQVAAVSAMESLDSTAVEEGQRKCGTDSLSNHVGTDSGPCLTQSRSSLWDGSVGLPRTTT